jgi:hypothetical protein
MTVTAFMTFEATLNHKIDENVKKTYMIIQSDRSFFLFFTAFAFLPAGHHFRIRERGFTF